MGISIHEWGCLDKLNGQKYKENIDGEINQHGRQLLNVCKSNKLIPLNMLKHGQKQFPGNLYLHKR